MICPYCHQEHPDNVSFCPITGKKLNKTPPACPNCRSILPQGVRFCPHCGLVLSTTDPSGRIPAITKRKPDWLVYGGAAVLLMVLTTVGIYWFFIHQPREPQSLTLEQDARPPLGQKEDESNQATILPPAEGQGITETQTATVDLILTPSPTDTAIHFPTDTPWFTQDPRTATTEVLLTQEVDDLLRVPTPTDVASLGLIAFNSNRTGNNDIYVMLSDGSQVTQLTNSPYDERVPSWSADGRQIAYQSNEGGDYELTVYDLESGRIRRLTNNSCDDYNPVWSPDGSRLAFYSDCDGNREIYVIDSDGSYRRQLTHTSDMYNWFPSWSPDGRQITFTSNRSGKYEIYIMNVDGSGVRALGRGCISAFSPDGEHLVFTQYCSDTGQIYLSRTDGSDLQIILEEENNANPSWSPDGQRLLFQSEKTGNEEIYVINIDGSELTQLTSDPGRDSAPVWQPIPYIYP